MSKAATNAQPTTVSERRRELVNQSRQRWISQLIDFSRRNNLLYFRELKTGTLDVSTADTEALTQLLQGTAVLLNKLLPGSDETRTSAKMQEIRRKSLANLEEKGLDTLFLSVGRATWTPADEGRPPEAPVLMVPLTAENRGREGRSIAILRNGDIQANLALLHFLQDQFGVSVAAETLIEAFQGDNENERFDPTPTFELLTKQASQIKGFSVASKMSIGNFSFQKMAMVRDLLELESALPAHDVIAAMSGDSEARAGVLRSFSDVEPRDLDGVPADAEHLVLDADSSQQRVIAIVEKGQHCIVHGPPGTGKSQTIANLIASLAANGKRILFVAEKRAALSVVLDRLERIGLGHLALDLHGADLTRQEILKKVARSLEQLRDSVPVDTRLHAQFEERRRQLNQHVARIHTGRPPAAQSIFEIQSRLLGLGDKSTSKTRWRGQNLDKLAPEVVMKIRDHLIELAGLEELFLRTDPSPWTGAVLRDGKAARQATEAASELKTRLLPKVKDELRKVETACRTVPHDSIQRVTGHIGLLERISNTRRKFSESVFTTDLTRLLQALEPARGGILSRIIAWCTNSAYRTALKEGYALLLDKNVRAAQVVDGLTSVRTQLQEWAAFANEKPPSIDVRAAVQALRDFNIPLKALGIFVPALKDASIPTDRLETVLNDLVADGHTPMRIPRLLEIETELQQLGLTLFVDELRSDRPACENWPMMFEHAWLSSMLDRSIEEDPLLAAFNGRTHDKFVEEFKALDRQRIELARSRVRRNHAERVIHAMNTHPDQTAIVRREAEKKRRHLPLRRLLLQAPDVLMSLCPCWMASPLSVSQLLPPMQACFDYVIFDEASQVLPEDSIPSIYRGRNLVVAGDKHQLPPTTFFAAADEEDEASDIATATEGFESLLDLASSFVQSARLDWHYRSRDERLIAFSNHHIYGDRLVTFPSPSGPSHVSHVLVAAPILRDGDEESASAEVEKVVDLVLDHAKERPDQSLGVIAMGITHARRVEAAMDKALRERAELDNFFDQSKAERFFIKNLERVQGDERDAVILTIGYGKDRSGKLLYRFGPLLQSGGERRLNVAVTRARLRMTLVSSFSHLDMDPTKVRSRGVEFLRDYLEYASTQGRHYGDVTTTQVPVNDFELDVMNALTARGMNIVAQVGASKYRIDLVVQDPDQPGKFLLAIECDGAMYHSSPTARDRDRLRQQHLEALGWKFHRIWSTDWFLRRESEIERALRAYKSAREASAKASRPIEKPTKVMNLPPGTTGTRKTRPPIAARENIDEYNSEELVRLIRWIKSDGRLRTDEEIVSEAVHELGFKRRGVRIEGKLKKAIDSAG
jgi:very-short-patch-repair endonuclease